MSIILCKSFFIVLFGDLVGLALLLILKCLDAGRALKDLLSE